MNAWYDSEMAFLYGNRYVPRASLQQNHILMAAPVWGVEFMETFVNYCIPSILAERNRKALASRCTLLLFTNRDSQRALLSTTHALSKYGIELVLRRIPDAVADEINKDNMNKFWTLGVAHTLAIQHAVRYGMGFSMLVPDHIYSDHYYESLSNMQQQHDVILQTSITADIEGMRNGLTGARRSDGSIEISAQELGELGFRHMHAQTKQYMIKPTDFPDKMPYTQFQVWTRKDSLAIYSGFFNPVWMSYAQCARIASASLSTLDTRMPDMDIQKFAVPGLEQEMVYIEMSSSSKLAMAPVVGKNIWIDRAWEQMKYDPAYMPYRQAPSHVPIMIQDEYATDEQIITTQKQIDAMLLAERGNSAIRRVTGPKILPEYATWDVHKL